MLKRIIYILIILISAPVLQAETLEGYYGGDEEGLWIAWTDYGRYEALSFSDDSLSMQKSLTFSLTQDSIYMDFGLLKMTGDIDTYGDIYGSWTDYPLSGFFSGYIATRQDHERFIGTYRGRYSNWQESGSFRIDVSGDGSVISRLSPDNGLSESCQGGSLISGDLFSSGSGQNNQLGHVIRGKITGNSFTGLLRTQNGTEFHVDAAKDMPVIIIPGENEESGSDCFFGVSSSGSHAVVAVKQ